MKILIRTFFSYISFQLFPNFYQPSITQIIQVKQKRNTHETLCPSLSPLHRFPETNESSFPAQFEK